MVLSFVISVTLADCGEYRQTAGAVAPKVIRVPVPMSAFGGKADITETYADVCF
jgi:hypothetical protein